MAIPKADPPLIEKIQRYVHASDAALTQMCNAPLFVCSSTVAEELGVPPTLARVTLARLAEDYRSLDKRVARLESFFYSEKAIASPNPGNIDAQTLESVLKPIHGELKRHEQLLAELTSATTDAVNDLRSTAAGTSGLAPAAACAAPPPASVDRQLHERIQRLREIASSLAPAGRAPMGGNLSLSGGIAADVSSTTATTGTTTATAATLSSSGGTTTVQMERMSGDESARTFQQLVDVSGTDTSNEPAALPRLERQRAAARSGFRTNDDDGMLIPVDTSAESERARLRHL